jgi:hypothetical protein
MQPIVIQNLVPSSIELVEISSSYKVLHYDDFPILFLGVNKFGNKILGSHLDDDDDEKKIWTIHTLLTNKEYYDFINKKKTYRELLTVSTTMFLVEKSYRNQILNSYTLTFDGIPIEYRPLENSYCPSYRRKFSFSYSLGLKGKLADFNRAIAEDVSTVQTAFADFLEGRLKNLKNFDLQPAAYLQPYSPGSFKINVELEFKRKKGENLFSHFAPIDEYIHEYVKYISTSVIQDKDLLSNNENVTASDAFLKLLATFEGLYDKALIKKPESTFEELKEDLGKAMLKFEVITEQMGENFNTIEFSNFADDYEEFISIIDTEYSESFQNTIDQIEASKSSTTIDEEDKEYEIYIYHLNTDTRQGNAFIKNLKNESEMSKPKIKILGDEPLEQTKYTESLHLNKWIKVAAKAKIVDDKFKFLTITYDA